MGRLVGMRKGWQWVGVRHQKGPKAGDSKWMLQEWQMLVGTRWGAHQDASTHSVLLFGTRETKGRGWILVTARGGAGWTVQLLPEKVQKAHPEPAHVTNSRATQETWCRHEGIIPNAPRNCKWTTHIHSLDTAVSWGCCFKMASPANKETRHPPIGICVEFATLWLLINHLGASSLGAGKPSHLLGTAPINGPLNLLLIRCGEHSLYKVHPYLPRLRKMSSTTFQINQEVFLT